MMAPSTPEAAVDLIRMGFSPIPIPLREKGPTLEGWQGLSLKEADVPHYFNGHAMNLGCRLGVQGAADADLDSREAVLIGPRWLPPTNRIFGRASKRASHYIYWLDPPIPSRKLLDPTDKATIAELRCLRADGEIGLQTVFPPSIHPTGEQIAYEPGKAGHPSNIEAPALHEAIHKIAAAALLAKHWPAAGSGRHDTMLALAGVLGRGGWTEADALQFCEAVYSAVTSPCPKGRARVPHEVSDTFAKLRSGAQATGIPRLKERIRPEVVKAAVEWLGIGAATDGVDLLAFLRNDVGNAQRLIAFKGDDFRYCYPFRCWFGWDGRRWARDAGGIARRAAQDTAIEFLRQAAGNEAAEKFARHSLDSRRLSAMLTEAEPHLVVTPNELDTDPNLLAFINGVVDLRTGQVRPHRREDFITKLVPFNYNSTARCPQFQRFLFRIMGATPDASQGDLERAARLVSYLQRVIGYALTGLTSEKAVFLVYGVGSNGKTTLLCLFLRLLPEHSVLLQIDTLMVRQESNNSLADLADLRGARFVMTSETEEGQRLAEGKLKRITQGMGRIKAVRKYENPIEFHETHKLFLDCNHKPVVRGRDNAIWSRLHLIPFRETITPEEIDRELPNKLYAEAEGILAWAVAGAVQWYREGLKRPVEVGRAGEEWREEMDQVGRFIGECCVRNEAGRVPARLLYQAYRKWAEAGGEHYLTETTFGKRMGDDGFSKRHGPKGAAYHGIRLSEGQI